MLSHTASVSKVTCMFVVALMTSLLAAKYSCSAYKILQIPCQHKSHIFNMLTIGNELSNRGHEVHAIISQDFKSFIASKAKESRVTVIEYLWEGPDALKSNVEVETEKFAFQFLEGAKTLDELWTGCARFFPTRCAILAKIREEAIERLRDEKFDLAVIDVNPTSMCSPLIALRLGIPWVTFTDFPLPWLMRVPWLPSFVPLQYSMFGEKMSFFERFINTALNMYMHLGGPAMEQEEDYVAVDDFRRRTNQTFLSLQELVGRAQFFLLDTDIAFDYPKPAMPNMVDIGGLITTEPKQLPDDIKNFIEKAEKGVVIVTFGTMLLKYPRSVVEKFVSAFKRLDGYRVVWRLENADNVKLPTNVKLWNWLPQNDVLGHPMAKLFITHCGNNGQFEAVYNKVPMIGFPLLADQAYNAARIQNKGYGLAMDIFAFTDDQLLLNMQQILNDPAYTKRLSSASEIFKSAPEKPAQRAARWIEYIAKYGGDHLRSAGNDLPMYKYLMLDIVAVMSLVVLIIVFILYKIVCALVEKLIVAEPRKKAD